MNALTVSTLVPAVLNFSQMILQHRQELARIENERASIQYQAELAFMQLQKQAELYLHEMALKQKAFDDALVYINKEAEHLYEQWKKVNTMVEQLSNQMVQMSDPALRKDVMDMIMLFSKEKDTIRQDQKQLIDDVKDLAIQHGINLSSCRNFQTMRVVGRS